MYRHCSALGKERNAGTALCHVKLCAAHAPHLYLVYVIYVAGAVGPHYRHVVFLCNVDDHFFVCTAFFRTLFTVSGSNDDHTADTELPGFFHESGNAGFRRNEHDAVRHFRKIGKGFVGLPAKHKIFLCVYKIDVYIVAVLQSIQCAVIAERTVLFVRADYRDCFRFEQSFYIHCRTSLCISFC